MKCISKEKLLFWPLMYILLAIVFWSASMYFYVHKSSSWTVSDFTYGVSKNIIYIHFKTFYVLAKCSSIKNF